MSVASAITDCGHCEHPPGATPLATAADDGLPPFDPRSDLTEMLRVLARSLLALNARSAHDARGASGMIFAASLPVVIGFGWLSAETGV